jgi:hypothetical protein
MGSFISKALICQVVVGALFAQRQLGVIEGHYGRLIDTPIGQLAALRRKATVGWTHFLRRKHERYPMKEDKDLRGSEIKSSYFTYCI